MPAKNNKVIEASTVTLTTFNGLKDKSQIRIAAIVKKIEEKATPYGTAKRFRGDVVVEGDSENIRAKNIFLPDTVRDAVINAAAKLGKWSSLEFVVTVIKSQKEGDKFPSYSHTFDIAPRIELPRVLSLLNS